MVLLLNIIVTLIFFGRTKNKQTETIKSSFFKVNVSIITNEKENSDLLLSVEENHLSDEQYNDYKQGLITYIIEKIMNILDKYYSKENGEIRIDGAQFLPEDIAKCYSFFSLSYYR